MSDRNRACDLCKKAPCRSLRSILCRDCADAISRVMSSEVYEINRYRESQAQLAQARLLSNTSDASDGSGVNPARSPNVNSQTFRSIEQRKRL